MKFCRWRRQLVCWACACVLGLPAFAADVLPTLPGLASALEQAWRLNPQAAALNAREVEARAAQELAGGLTPEPGTVSVGSRNDRLNRNLGQREYEVELTTPLWLPGQRAARQTEAASLQDGVAAKRAALRLELAGEVREAWWALATARNAARLAARRLQTALSLEADVLRRFKAGDLSRIDANLARTEVHAAQSDQIEAELTQLQTEQAYRSLTGAPAPQDMGEEGLAPEPGHGARSSEIHPLLAAATAAARSSRARLKVAEESRRAAPDLSFRMVRDRTDFTMPYANSIGVKLTVPFSSDARVRRESSVAQSESDQADAESLRVQTRIELDIERAQAAWAAAQRLFAMAQERNELAAENLRLAEKAFALGESDLATLLRIRAAAFDAAAFLDRQRVVRAASVSRLNQAWGVLP